MSNGVDSVTFAHPTNFSSPRVGTPALSELSPVVARVRTDCRNRPYHSVGRYRPRRLRVLFRRNPEHDGERDRIRYEGYHMVWPDGGEVTVGFQRFCQQGSRLLGLGKRMKGKEEQMVELVLHPVSGLEAPLTRVGPGIRFRRFYIQRQDGLGRFHFFNGSPTDLVFDPYQDDPRVVEWLGLKEIEDGEDFWFDLSAQTLDEEEEEVVEYAAMAG